MPNDITPPDPARFSLARIADLLHIRDQIIGEDPGLFDGFRNWMIPSLAPVTPYERVIAENLIAIEWELLQHRRMRDAGLRTIIRKAICRAVVAREEAAHEAAPDEPFDKHEEAGGTEVDREDPFAFDEEAAEATGHELPRDLSPAMLRSLLGPVRRLRPWVLYQSQQFLTLWGFTRRRFSDSPWQRRFAMPAAIPLRRDFAAPILRELSRRCRDNRQIRRLAASATGCCSALCQ